MAGFGPVGALPVAAVPANDGFVLAPRIRRRQLLFANVGASIVTPVINPPVVTVPVPDRYYLHIINPDAEFRDMTGWTTIYGNPTVTTGGPTGSRFHFYGNTATVSTMRQMLTIPDAEFEGGKTVWGEIDANRALANWSYQGARQSQPPSIDQTCMSVQYLDANQFPIGTYVPPMDSTSLNWALVEITNNPMPAGTRFLNLDVLAFEGNPTFNDAYTDNYLAWLSFRDDIYPLELPILNPDADRGTIEGWTAVSGTPTTAPGPSGAGTLPRSGRNYWYAGNVAFSSMRQDIAIPAVAIADVDAGLLTLDYFWYQNAGDTDQQRLRVEFRDAALGLISSDTPALTSDGGGVFGWVVKNPTPAVPVGTRTIRIFSDMQRVTGTSNDGYSAAYRMRLLK